MLLNSVLIVTEQSNPTTPLHLIILEGLAVKSYFSDERGHGIEITHRDGIYPNKIFTFVNERLQ